MVSGTVIYLGSFAAVEGESPRGAALPILVALLIVAAIVWWFTRKDQDPAPGPAPQGGDASHAGKGGDAASLATGDHSPATVYQNSPVTNYNYVESSHDRSSLDEGLRRVKDEIGHIQRRFGQFDEQREEWDSIWPIKEVGPYRILPSEQWNRYGPSLGLSDPDHEAVREAYELANDFNHKMQAGPATFGTPEPDLEALRAAFRRAAEVVSPLASPSRPRTGAINRGDMELEDSTFAKDLDTGLDNRPGAKFKGKNVDFK